MDYGLGQIVIVADLPDPNGVNLKVRPAVLVRAEETA
jgi:hypothetical protein